MDVLQDMEEMKHDALILLRLLIAGFRPVYILEQLLEDKGDRTFMSFPKWVKSFYVYYLSEYVPERLGAIRTKLAEIDRLIRFLNDLSSGTISITDLIKLDEGIREAIGKLQNLNVADVVEWLRSGIGVLGFEVVTLLNLYTPIQDGTVWKHTPKRLNRFNNYSFKPGMVKMGPRWNLTTWLLGRRNEIDTLMKGEREDGTVAKAWQPYGKLYQLLRDKYKPQIIEKSKTRSYGTIGDLYEQFENLLSQNDEEETDEKLKIKLKKELLDLGANSRNINVYFNWKIDGYTQSETAKDYRLTERQIRRICQQIKRLVAKLNHRIYEE